MHLALPTGAANPVRPSASLIHRCLSRRWPTKYRPPAVTNGTGRCGSVESYSPLAAAPQSRSRQSLLDTSTQRVRRRCRAAAQRPTAGRDHAYCITSAPEDCLCLRVYSHGCSMFWLGTCRTQESVRVTSEQRHCHSGPAVAGRLRGAKICSILATEILLPLDLIRCAGCLLWVPAQVQWGRVLLHSTPCPYPCTARQPSSTISDWWSDHHPGQYVCTGSREAVPLLSLIRELELEFGSDFRGGHPCGFIMVLSQSLHDIGSMSSTIRARQQSS